MRVGLMFSPLLLLLCCSLLLITPAFTFASSSTTHPSLLSSHEDAHAPSSSSSPSSSAPGKIGSRPINTQMMKPKPIAGVSTVQQNAKPTAITITQLQSTGNSSSSSSSSPSPLSCGVCVNGACVSDSLSGLAVCACSKGYWGSTCQYGPGGGGVCSTTVANSATLLLGNPWFKAVNWTGSSSKAPALPCGANGQCSKDGYCVCNNYYIGAYCQRAPCPNNCSFAGYCSYPPPSYSPTCLCSYGTSGADCSIGACNNCSGHGTCVAQPPNAQSTITLNCVCDIGYTGAQCQQQVCPSCAHGTCDTTTNTCKCEQGFTGPTCNDKVCPNQCNQRGQCNVITGFCECQAPYSGDDCSLDLRLCPNRCSDKGVCTPIGCKCPSGSFGLDCGSLQCPNNCSSHGVCTKNGVCQCQAAYSGADCSLYTCANNCSNNGICSNGKCMCSPPWTGEVCDRKLCPDQCNGRGLCVDGVCQCYNATDLLRLFPDDGPIHEWGFSGSSCEFRKCYSDCGVKAGRGVCNTTTGQCQCKEGFWGPDGQHCNSVLCSDPCNGRGFCVDNTCICDASPDRTSGWTGAKCELPMCPNNCFAHLNLGVCVNGACNCTEEWYGPDCSLKKCPMNYSPLVYNLSSEKSLCSAHGRCVDGVCQCDTGFTGVACDLRQCTNNCSAHGTCQPNGECVCDAGYTGISCEQKKCSSDCGSKKKQGECDGKTGQCNCNPGFYGDDCSHQKCDDSCNKHGACMDGMCVCAKGWDGEHCEYQICQNDCFSSLGQGKCVNNTCVCSSGFYGIDCHYKLCPVVPSPRTNYTTNLTCAGQGVCDAGECVCNDAWSGPTCTDRGCPMNCNDVGNCLDNGLCQCPTGDQLGRGGYAGKFCELPICPNNCTQDLGHGKCVDKKCVCADGYYGDDCKHPKCPSDLSPLSAPNSLPVMCSGHGTCVDGVCQCVDSYQGPACNVRPCLNNCSGHGVCSKDGVCTCTDQYEREDCSLFSCPAGCSQHGKCVNGKCVCDKRWTGERCEIVKCPNGCSLAGACIRKSANISGVITAYEECQCDPGFTGVDCSKPICDPADCLNKGQCVVSLDGLHVCRCNSPYVGAECGNNNCNKTCSYNGLCINNKCSCDVGWFGENCDRKGDCSPFDCFGRGTCVAGPTNNPICKCRAPFGGPDCSLCTSNCSSHGVCSPNGCVCDAGWEGANCERNGPCYPADCSKRGECVADKLGNAICKCRAPFYGPDCMDCTNDCNFRGECGLDGKCKCDPGWKGEHCDRAGDCVNDCSGKGVCVGDNDGEPNCKCNPGYGGVDCSSLLCSLPCKGHATCLDNQCVCNEGWTGDTCEERKDCPNKCNGNGVCMGDFMGNPFCKCNLKWGGVACELPRCADTCSDHGTCLNGKCVCDAGWSGVDCSILDCSVWKDCSGHGTCTVDKFGNAMCACKEPWTGTNCSDVKCTTLSCKNGVCINNQCVCNKGWKGRLCDYTVPCEAPGCGKYGECMGDGSGNGTSVCQCMTGYTGKTCQDLTCDKPCSKHGKCINEECECDSGYHGVNCEIAAPCPNNCTGHGVCAYDEVDKKSVCDCDPLWDGPACDIKRGNSWLNDQGQYQYQCILPYYGPNCIHKHCAGTCANGATCNQDGECECTAGFKGTLCDQYVCPKGCSGGGDCDLQTSFCRCYYGYSGIGCEYYNSAVCVSSCQLKCQLLGSSGLVPIRDQAGLVHYVNARTCNDYCVNGGCNTIFGTGTGVDESSTLAISNTGSSSATTISLIDTQSSMDTFKNFQVTPRFARIR